MIDLNHNRACELSEAKHDKNIIFNRACELDEVNHVRSPALRDRLSFN